MNNGTLYLTTGSLSTWTDITGDGTIITLGNISGNAGQFGNDIVNDYTLTLTGFTGGTISNGTIFNNISGKGNIIIDGRNIFDEEDLVENGFEYHCIGK